MSFAKHETFHIREGWLFKGMAAIKEAEEQGRLPTIFREKDAPERLGIGRNMVRALRFWLQATGLTDEHLEERQSVQRLTEFGEWVWANDRYLDDMATLWLIHYYLVSQKEQATTWYWFFNHFAPTSFDAPLTFESLKLWVINDQPEQVLAENSLQKDISCLIRTYIVSQKPLTPEELTESPLARLDLLSQVDSGTPSRYRLERSNAANIHPLVLLYVLIDRQRQVRPGSWQVNLSQVLREPMNAGRVFNLTSATLTDLLTLLKQLYPEWTVQLVRTAGLDELNLPPIEVSEILAGYARETFPLLEAA